MALFLSSTDLKSEGLEGDDGEDVSLALGVRGAVGEHNTRIAVHCVQQGEIFAHALSVLQCFHLVQSRK